MLRGARSDVESTDLRNRDDRSSRWRRDRAGNGGILAQSEMGS